MRTRKGMLLLPLVAAALGGVASGSSGTFPIRPFANARVPSTTPQLAMVATDSGPLRYEVEWSTDPTFATKSAANSSNGGFVDLTDGSSVDPFPSGHAVGITLPVLTNGSTYWWRARSRVPALGPAFGPFAVSRSFTVATASPDTAWWMRSAAQMQRGAISGTVVNTSGPNVEIGQINQVAGPFSPSSCAGQFATCTGANAPGGTVASVGAKNRTGTWTGFNIAVSTTGGAISGLQLSFDGYNTQAALGASAHIALSISTDGCATFSSVTFQPGILSAVQTTFDIGDPTDLWSSFLSGNPAAFSNFCVEAFTAQVNGGPADYNIDWLRATVYYTTLGTAGTFTSGPVYASELANANGGIGWSQVQWTKVLPAGCNPPLCDVTIDVLDPSGDVIPGFGGLTSSPVSILGIDPATYPSILLRGNFLRNSPSPMLSSLLVNTAGGNPLTAEVLGLTARRVDERTVHVSWATDPTARIASFEVLEAPAEEGAFAPITTVAMDPGGAFTDYAYDDRRPDDDDAWYLLDVRRLDGTHVRVGPVVALALPPPEGGCACRAGGGRTTLGPALLFGVFVIALGLRRKGDPR